MIDLSLVSFIDGSPTVSTVVGGIILAVMGYAGKRALPALKRMSMRAPARTAKKRPRRRRPIRSIWDPAQGSIWDD